jgi:hypothetical protein
MAAEDSVLNELEGMVFLHYFHKRSSAHALQTSARAGFVLRCLKTPSHYCACIRFVRLVVTSLISGLLIGNVYVLIFYRSALSKSTRETLNAPFAGKHFPFSVIH